MIYGEAEMFVVLVLVGFMLVSGLFAKIAGNCIISALYGVSPYLTVGIFILLLWFVARAIKRRRK